MVLLKHSISQIEDWKYLYTAESGSKYVRYRKIGNNLVEVDWYFNQNTTTEWLAGNLPTEYRSGNSIRVPSTVFNESYGGTVRVANTCGAAVIGGGGDVLFRVAANSSTGSFCNCGHVVYSFNG